MNNMDLVEKYLGEGLDHNKMLKQAEKLHANATREGSIKIGSTKYDILFNTKEGIYSFTDPQGNEVYRANSRKITVAKKWFKEFMTN